MDIHKNARPMPHGRERIVHQVLSGQTRRARRPSAGSDRPHLLQEALRPGRELA
jgi:hypothetical protein